MAKPVKHPEFPGVTSETHPNLYVDGAWRTAETHPGLFKKDGTPRKYVDRSTLEKAPRRSNEELLADYQDRLVKAKERHAKEIAGVEKKIAYFTSGGSGRKGVDPAAAAAAAHDLMSKGMSPEQIIAFAEQARLAVAGIKGKSEDEIKALASTPPPSLAVTMAPAAV